MNMTDITLLDAYEEFEDYVITLMGGNLVSVEIEDKDITTAYHKAKRIYQKRGNNNLKHRFISFPVEKGKSEYELPIEDARIETIVKVIQSRGGFVGGTEDLFEISYINSILRGTSTNGSVGVDMMIYELSMMQLDNLKRLTAHEPQFIHDRLNNTIKFLKLPGANENWFLECYLNLTDEEYMDMDWIQRYTVAELKHILGSAYRKFQSLDGPTGQTSLPGSELVQEGIEEKRELLEEIKNFVDSGAPIGGPIIIG